MNKQTSDAMADDIFGLANSIAGDILKDNTKSVKFGSEQTSFGKLIDSQQRQLKIITKTYEDEIVVMVDKMGDLGLILDEYQIKVTALNDKISSLEAEKENAEELLGKYQMRDAEESKKETKVAPGDKNAGKKSKPKVPK